MGVAIPEIDRAHRPAAGTSGQRLPLTILTGFLGAGKTTCLNGFLRSPQAAETAVLVNEFGAIDVDGAVLSSSLSNGSTLVALPNGCVCCAVQDDLAEALVALAERRRSGPSLIARCIVETTGLADPAAIIRGVGHDPRLRRSVFVDQTVTVCAADRVLDQLARFPEVPRQIGVADRIVLSKADLVSEDRQKAVIEKLIAINPVADVRIAIRAAMDPQHPLGPPSRVHVPLVAPIERPADIPHDHSPSVRTFAVGIGKPLDPDRFRDVLSFLILRHAENLLRIKGVVRFTGDDRPRLLNGVHDVFTSQTTAGAGPAPHAGGTIVFIGIDLPEAAIRSDLRACESTV